MHMCMQVGQSVFALGRTYGAGPAFSAGVVSALNRGVPSPMGTTITGSIQVRGCVPCSQAGAAYRAMLLYACVLCSAVQHRFQHRLAQSGAATLDTRHMQKPSRTGLYPLFSRELYTLAIHL